MSHFSWSKFFTSIILLWMAIGCAAIIHGTSQKIDVRSTPDNAEVYVDGIKSGSTPAILNLERKGEYLVRIVKEGYSPAEIKISGKVSGWIIGNIIFGGIIGCGIDFLTGGAYDLTPESIMITLSKMEALNGKTIEIDPEKLYALKSIRLLNDSGDEELVIHLNWLN